MIVCPVNGLRRSGATAQYGTRVALRCLYTDLDGTLLGKFGNLFGDAEGNFSRSQALMLEACHRAGVEVVIMSGRREETVRSDSRLIGQTSYIYEAGCAMVIDGETTYLTGEWLPDEERRRRPSGSSPPASPTCSSSASGRCLEWHAPWHDGRELSLLIRGKVDVEEANELIAAQGEAGADLRFLDNGAIGRPMEGVEVDPRLPPGPGRGEQGQGGRRAHAGPRLRAARSASPPATRSRTSAPRSSSAASSASPTGPRATRCCARPRAGLDNVTVTEGRMGEGVYEAVVSTLAGATA